MPVKKRLLTLKDTTTHIFCYTNSFLPENRVKDCCACLCSSHHQDSATISIESVHLRRNMKLSATSLFTHENKTINR